MTYITNNGMDLGDLKKLYRGEIFLHKCPFCDNNGQVYYEKATAGSGNMAKPNLLNVRVHLTHLQDTLNLYKLYGDCPLFKEEVAKLSVINKAILDKHKKEREAGNRKDIRIGA